MRDSRVSKTKTITSWGNTERHGEGREKSQCELKAGTFSSPQSPRTAPPPSQSQLWKGGGPGLSLPPSREPKTRSLGSGGSVLEGEGSEAGTEGWETRFLEAGGARWLGPFIQSGGRE